MKNHSLSSFSCFEKNLIFFVKARHGTDLANHTRHLAYSGNFLWMKIALKYFIFLHCDLCFVQGMNSTRTVL